MGQYIFDCSKENPLVPGRGKEKFEAIGKLTYAHRVLSMWPQTPDEHRRAYVVEATKAIAEAKVVFIKYEMHEQAAECDVLDRELGNLR